MNELYWTIAIPLTILGVGVIIYCIFREMVKITGSNHRASERERSRYFNMIERLVEKEISPSKLETNYRHAMERVNEVRQQAEVEKAAIKEKVETSAHMNNRIHESNLYATENDLPVQGDNEVL